MRSIWVNCAGFPQLLHTDLCLQADCTHGNWNLPDFTLDHKTEGMPSIYYELQLRIIEDQILILLRHAEFPLPWAIGTVKPWILWEFTFAFSYGH